jgi:alpha-L-fucosidase
MKRGGNLYNSLRKQSPSLIIDTASEGGNYLLNVGPTSDGLIPDPSIERLQGIAAWMKINGDAIHGTSA